MLSAGSVADSWRKDSHILRINSISSYKAGLGMIAKENGARNNRERVGISGKVTIFVCVELKYESG